MLVVVAVSVVVLAYVVVPTVMRKRKWNRLRERWSKASKDVVIVHGFPRGKISPNPSPFVLKVETYLRMAEVPYELETQDSFGEKGKTPWIHYNGEHVADSQFIIKYLNKKFEKNLNGSYTKDQLATAHLIRIALEEHVRWGYVLHVFNYRVDLLNRIAKLPLPFWIVKLIAPPRFGSIVKTQGMGVHSKEQVYELCLDTLKQISCLLGTKNFILGNEPCEDDAAIFSCLSAAAWGAPESPFEEAINRGELTNLRDYCHRMRERYWPDWNQLLSI